MTPKQKAFVNAYLVDRNATQAAKKAGYSEKTAYSQGQRLLKDAEIAGAVEKAQRRAAERAEITMAGHVAKLQELRDAALAAGQVGAAIRAEELTGKVAGLYTERVEHSGSIGRALTDEERESHVLAIVRTARQRQKGMVS